MLAQKVLCTKALLLLDLTTARPIGLNDLFRKYQSNSPVTKVFSGKSVQQMATERLFQPASHHNTAELISLCDELGLDSSDMVATETMLLCLDLSSLQRLAACLKIGPQSLFKNAFLTTHIPSELSPWKSVLQSLGEPTHTPELSPWKNVLQSLGKLSDTSSHGSSS